MKLDKPADRVGTKDDGLALRWRRGFMNCNESSARFFNLRLKVELHNGKYDVTVGRKNWTYCTSYDFGTRIDAEKHGESRLGEASGYYANADLDRIRDSLNRSQRGVAVA